MDDWDQKCAAIADSVAKRKWLGVDLVALRRARAARWGMDDLSVIDRMIGYMIENSMIVVARPFEGGMETCRAFSVRYFAAHAAKAVPFKTGIQFVEFADSESIARSKRWEPQFGSRKVKDPKDTIMKEANRKGGVSKTALIKILQINAGLIDEALNDLLDRNLIIEKVVPGKTKPTRVYIAIDVEGDNV